MEPAGVTYEGGACGAGHKGVEPGVGRVTGLTRTLAVSWWVRGQNPRSRPTPVVTCS